MEEHVELFEGGWDEPRDKNTVVLTKKVNRAVKITITKSPDGIITGIDAPSGVRFPYSVGQLLNRNIETWCCTNGWLMNGKDTCPEEKIFGVPKKYAEHDPFLRGFIRR